MLPPLMRPQKFAAKAMAEKVIRIVSAPVGYTNKKFIIGTTKKSYGGLVYYDISNVAKTTNKMTLSFTFNVSISTQGTTPPPAGTINVDSGYVGSNSQNNNNSYEIIKTDKNGGNFEIPQLFLNFNYTLPAWTKPIPEPVNGLTTFTYTITYNPSPETAVAVYVPTDPNLFLANLVGLSSKAKYVMIYNNTSKVITYNLGPLGSYLIESGNGILAYNKGIAASCFLAGSPVTLADGTTKLIEHVQVGDIVLGAFGEHNTVTALKHGKLGLGKMCKINDEHITTLNHPHITPTKGFTSCNGSIATDGTVLTDTHSEIVNNASDDLYYSLFELKKGSIKPLQLGSALKTVDGQKTVTTLELLNLSADTSIYNLYVNGSHTYYVNGYAVTGGMYQTDFDVDTWTVKA